MTHTTTSTEAPALERPHLDRRTARSAGNVWAVLRRELEARLPTGAYVWSTLLFAAMALLSPLLLPTSDVARAPVIAVTTDSEHLVAALQSGGLATELVDSPAAGEARLQDDSVDALLMPSTTAEGWVLVGKTSVPDSLLNAVQTLTTLDAVSSIALDGGVAPEALATGVSDAAISTHVLNGADDATWAGVLVALGFGLVIVFVIVLWGATMATDVVQEKSTRVVEILIATIRPWQLLAGKIAAITIVGLVQIVVILGAAYAGIQLFAGGIDLTFISAPVLITGLVSVVIGVPLLAALMAAMAARVEHQDELSTATQPVYLLLMAPFAAAVYAGLYAPDGAAMHILSLAPFTNIFAMPARVAAGPVPGWELGLSLVIALLTLAAAVLLAGRIYSGSILRAGNTVSLRQALGAR